MYIASDIEVLGSNRYLASLNVQNIENDVNVSVIIKNDLDSLRQDFHVKFQPPLEIIDDITGAKIPYWIFVVVGLVIIFLVLCALVVFCSTKSTRQQKKDDQHKAYLRRYLGEVAREAKPNKHIVNLDDVPEQSLPMLSNANISSPQDNFSNVTMTSGNDASNEASDNVSLIWNFLGKFLQIIIFFYQSAALSGGAARIFHLGSSSQIDLALKL